MKKFLNCLSLSIAVLIASHSFAGFGVAVSAGTSDYEYSIVEADFSDSISDGFFYRDVSFDYQKDNHQFIVKVGGLASQSGAVQLQGGTSPVVEDSDAERSEWNVSYTWRPELNEKIRGALSLGGGYYSSELSSSRGFSYTTEVPIEIDGIPAGTANANVVQVGNKVVDNDGFFVLASYGIPLKKSDGVCRYGCTVYASIGMQWSDASESTDNGLDITPVAANVTPYSETNRRNAGFDGTATIFGLGMFVGLPKGLSLSIFYDLKDFSFDGSAYEEDDVSIAITEKQPTFGLRLRKGF